jgi:hypothetical protein
MSRSIDLFIDSARPIQELAAEIQRLTGMAMEAAPDGSSWMLQEGGIRADLRAHPYVSDGELVLERFRYTLGSRVGNDTRLLDAPETTLLRMVSEALQKAGFATLLVHDLQYRDGSVVRPDHSSGGPVCS